MTWRTELRCGHSEPFDESKPADGLVAMTPHQLPCSPTGNPKQTRRMYPQNHGSALWQDAAPPAFAPVSLRVAPPAHEHACLKRTCKPQELPFGFPQLILNPAHSCCKFCSHSTTGWGQQGGKWHSSTCGMLKCPLHAQGHTNIFAWWRNISAATYSYCHCRPLPRPLAAAANCHWLACCCSCLLP